MEANQCVWVPTEPTNHKTCKYSPNFYLQNQFLVSYKPPSSPASPKKKTNKQTFSSPALLSALCSHLLILLQNLSHIRTTPTSSNNINTPIGISYFFVKGSLSLPLLCSIFRDFGMGYLHLNAFGIRFCFF